MSGTKNKLTDLNNHLFAQLERLADESLAPEKLELEIKRGDTIVDVADQIIRSAALQVAAAKLVAEHGDKVTRRLPLMLDNGRAIENGKAIEAKSQ